MTPLQRITIVLDFYLERGINSERINSLYFKILTLSKTQPKIEFVIFAKQFGQGLKKNII